MNRGHASPRRPCVAFLSSSSPLFDTVSRHGVSETRIAPSPPDSTPVVAIDVECVATGTTHNDRAVAQIAIVDARTERVVLDVYVKPTMPVTSYLTPLTGITETLLNERGVSFDEALGMVRAVLSPGHVVVGQGVLKDMDWWATRARDGLRRFDRFSGGYGGCGTIGSSRGACFRRIISCARCWGRRWTRAHDAVGRLREELSGVAVVRTPSNTRRTSSRRRAKLLAVPPEPSFAKRFPSFEGVCQGNRRTCSCGAPFFS